MGDSKPLEVDFLTAQRLDSHGKIFGILRYLIEISKRQSKYGIKLREIALAPIRNKYAAKAALFSYYPIKIIKSLRSRIVHVSSQTHAFLFLPPIFSNKVKLATVYDIAPHIRNSEISGGKKFLESLNMSGLKKADHLIAISIFTKKEIMEKLGIPSGKISVIYPAVDHNEFKPMHVGNSFYSKYRLPENRKIILYVGSEEPRQNLSTLAKALGILKKKGIGFTFIKIGTPAWPNGREKFISQLKENGVFDESQFLDYVEEADLPKFYNIASVFAYPCEYTGFGLPPLEAMACGCPTISSNAASIPEVTGNGAISLSPKDYLGFACYFEKILSSKSFSKQLSKQGILQAKKFSWEKSARQTAKLYFSLQNE